MASSIVATVVPTGGAITLAICAAGPMTLSRAPVVENVTGDFMQLYTGPEQEFWVDAGDMLPGPLPSSNSYVYQLVDDNGTIETFPIQPTASLAVQIDPFAFLMQRLIQGAVNNLYLPAGVKKADVMQAMPIAGLPPLPLITINMNNLNQREIPIGQSAWVPDENGNIIVTGFAYRLFQISILSLNGPERDFYRDAMIGIFQAIVGAVLAPASRDLTHSYDISSGQVSKDTEGKAPGFYYADCMLEFTGLFNIVISTNFGYIETIDFTAYAPDGNETKVTVTAA